MAILPVLLSLFPALAVPQDLEVDALQELSIEELLDIKVTSVSRTERSVVESPAAVFVITQEDIRRSGLTTLAELLRTVPGLHVARVNSNTWAIGARGGASRFSNSLLVMIDGRSVYSNLFSGVFWDVQDTLLEDIERIEVIRGPGGSVWGANAVEGVINVITKSAADTQGGFISLLAGNEDRGIVSVRNGGELESGGHWRTFAKWTDRDGSADTDTSMVDDPWRSLRGGFRMDWDDDADVFTLQGDVYDTRLREGLTFLNPDPPMPVLSTGTQEKLGANLLGRWTHTTADGESYRLQGYVDQANFDAGVFEDNRLTIDLDFQATTTLADAHDIVWGVGYRLINGRFEGMPTLDVDPQYRSDSLFSCFLQDEVGLSDTWTMLFGTKVEHNEFTGFEYEPSLRFLWSPEDGDRSFWTAVSRAVRMPSVVDDGLFLPSGVIPGMPPVVLVTQGSRDFESERLIAYEAGYRSQVREDLLVDVTAYYFDYDDQSSLTPGTPYMSGSVMIQPLLFDNGGEGEAWGFELASQYEATDTWRLDGSFTWTDRDVDDIQGLGNPDYLGHLRSRHDLREDVELDLNVYSVGGFRGVRSYVRGDARVAWRPRDGYEVSFVVQNAFDDQHQEFVDELLTSAREIERAAYVQLTWRP